jgi:hypothetical protein
MIRCARVAWCRKNVRKDRTRKQVERGASKGQKEGKRLWRGPECKIGIKDPGTRWQLHLEIEKTSDRIDRKAFGLEFVKRAPGMSSGLWKMRKWTLWRGRPPPKRKKRSCTE